MSSALLRPASPKPHTFHHTARVDRCWMAAMGTSSGPNSRWKSRQYKTCEAQWHTDRFHQTVWRVKQQHLCLVQNQSGEYRSMIQNCNESTVIVHVYFSEAWKCKYSSEVQSCHFGQNIPQINLHTGMYYTEEEKRDFVQYQNPNNRNVSAILDSQWNQRYLFKISKSSHHSLLVGWPQQAVQKQEELSSAVSLQHWVSREHPGTSSPLHMGRELQLVMGELWKGLQTVLYNGENDIVDGKIFHEMVGRSLCSTVFGNADGGNGAGTPGWS